MIFMNIMFSVQEALEKLLAFDTKIGNLNLFFDDIFPAS